MKKCTIIGGVAILLGFSIMLASFVDYKQKVDSLTYIVVEEEDEVPLEGEIPGSTLSQEELNNKLGERMALCPKVILDAFVADGWQIVMTEENLSDKYFQGIYSTVNAVTDSTIKTIWIANTERAVNKSVLHEFGHYLDFKYGIINRSDEFQRIYEAEKWNFKVVSGSSAYAKSSSQEYFGEAFQQCILNPQGMIENTPQTYAFIMSLVEQL